MSPSPDANRRHADPAGIGLGVGDEVRNRLRWMRWIHHHHKRCAHDARDWRNVANEIKVELLIFVAFLAYCLHVTLRARLKPLAPGLTPRAVLDKFAAIQMLDVHFPTTDGRTLILSRYTELTADQKLLVQQLKLDLPPQPPPRISSSGKAVRAPDNVA